MPTPMATRTPAFSTLPPQHLLCHTPSMNTYGYSCPNGRSRHASISAYTFLSLSLNVCEGMRSPHSNWLISSTRRVLTPARYMSISASSTLLRTIRSRVVSNMAWSTRGIRCGMASRPAFRSRFSNVWRLKIVHRTRAMPLSQAQTKVRKISDVIFIAYASDATRLGRFVWRCAVCRGFPAAVFRT